MGKLMPVCVLFMWFGLCFRKWCYFFGSDFKGSVKLVFCWPPVDGDEEDEVNCLGCCGIRYFITNNGNNWK